MNRTRRLIATLGVILMAGIAPATGVIDQPWLAPAVTNGDAESGGTSIVPETSTALVVLCFPGGGCIVCHNGYCEYTSRT
jgi:hypothetical protein